MWLEGKLYFSAFVRECKVSQGNAMREIKSNGFFINPEHPSLNQVDKRGEFLV